MRSVPITVIQRSIGNSRQCNKLQNEINSIQIKKEEIKPFLFVDDTMIYIENPKEATKTSRTKKQVQQGNRIQH